MPICTKFVFPGPCCSTRYSTTPTLSVADAQLRLIWLLLTPVAMKIGGIVGGTWSVNVMAIAKNSCGICRLTGMLLVNVPLVGNVLVEILFHRGTGDRLRFVEAST